MLLSNQVDGVLLASAHEPTDTVWRKTLAGLSVPMVLIDRRLTGLNFVGGDDTGIGYEATRHLYNQGYRRIAHIAGPRTVTTAVGRLSGYRRALAALRLPSEEALVIETHYHEESGGYEAMQRLLKLPAPPDAVFAASDPIAIVAHLAGGLGSKPKSTRRLRVNRGWESPLRSISKSASQHDGSTTIADRSHGG